MMWRYGWGWGMPMFGGPLLLIIIFGAVVYYFTRRNGSTDMPKLRATLDRRYAAGEITKEQYDQMKRDLAQ